MSAPLTMSALARAYLAERRHLGFALDRSGSLTLGFARFADASGHVGALTSAIVLRWAKEEAQLADPFTWAGRVNVLRPFARYLGERDPNTAFPEDSPFGRATRRLAPHIYTQGEVSALLAAASRIPPNGGLRPATFTALFGLLDATGLRISEALGLSCGDIDNRQEHLTIRHAKFQRTRLVPLHPTVGEALRAYLPVRARYGSMEPVAPLFLSENTGRALQYQSVRDVFLKLTADLGIAPRGSHPSIRIHDLRHSFICRRLMLWQAGGENLGNAMMALATYVGHINIGDTYWYLQAVPELMAIAGNRFEAFGTNYGEAHHG
jgi:integrase/recombinase XerD